MRLDFNVLWVDDQPEQLRSQIEAIAQHMSDEGFAFNPKTCRSLDEVKAVVAEEIFQDEVDLILVDWDLGAGLKGQDVISEIRGFIPYKDVVFYSSLTEVKKLREEINKKFVDGVFCAGKREIVQEVSGVFDTLIKKVLDLDHTRGIVMGATSDIDHMTIACLGSINAAGDDQQKHALLAKAKDLVAASLKNMQKKMQKLENASSLGELLEAHAVFTANDRLRALKEALTHAQFDEHAPLKEGLGAYIKRVVPMRNDLGHVVLVPAGRPSELLGVEGKVVTIDEMRDLRRFLLGFRSDLRKLRDTLSGS